MRRLILMRCNAFAGLLAAGCQLTPTPAPAPQLPSVIPARLQASVLPPVRQVTHAEPALPAAQGSGLDELLGLARERNPQMIAAAARVGEARGQMIQAGLYPNPTVGYSASQMNDGPGTAGQQGGFVSQEFVTAGKLKIAREAARYGVTAADWRATSQWYDTAARVKAAYYEYVAAVAVLRETERMGKLFEEALKRTEKLAAGGKVDSYDVSRLKVEVVQTANRIGNAKQRVAANERLLAVAVGMDRLPDGIASGELPNEVPVLAFDAAAAMIGQSSFVQSAAAEANQAQNELRLAEVKPIPNLHTMTTVAQDYAINAPVVSVQVGVPLPLWDRNQGNIVAARARSVAAVAAVEQARLRTVERLTLAYQRYENARRQLDLYRTKVLPDAAAALEQIDKVYEAKGERFFDTLDARRVLAQARIDYVQALGDLWAAIAEIESLIQQPR